ncbi:DUF1579 domain-containing protein [Brevundimonas sp.]|mgnify:CR=1 FL=1|uniref:DUF1579 domain-containing protein n=1 Tax=Brevundimonas sp. TaxID=1871086 RepID=UPI0025DFDE24|nr:DUF1579 domain-containing protein [Brevundimonas sp.]
MRMRAIVFSAVLALSAPGLAMAQAMNPAGSDEQRQQVADLSFLDGEWRGEAVIFNRDGSRTTLTQTERVGPLLGGSIRVVEGRGYDAAGVTVFNAMAVISWDEREDRYRFRSWANGHDGDFRFERTDTGFVWEVPAGPGAVVRYTATVQDGVWHEVGAYMREGMEPRPTIEMTLRRIGESDWPAGGAVPSE